MTGIKHLWELQTLEEEKLDLERKARTFPEVRELKMLKADIEENQAKIQVMKDELVQIKRNLKQEESGIMLLKEKMEKASTQLYSGEITNAKELETAEKNMEINKEKVEEAEDRALVLMEQAEKAEEQIKQLLKDLDTKKGQFRELNKSYTERKAGLARALEEHEARNKKLVEKIDPQLMQKFCNLCGRFDDKKGVALLENGVCSGCHMSVSFDLLKQSKNKPKELMCDNCGRLLLVE